VTAALVARVQRRVDPRFVPLLGTIAVFVLTAGYGSLAYPSFFSAQVFLNLLIDNAFLCIVGVGMTFVILSGGIDLSVGAVIALTTMVSAALVEHHHWNAALAIPLVLALGTAFGALMGWLIERFRLQPFIVTLAGMFLARTTVLVYTFSGFCSALAGVVFTFYMLSGYGLHAVGLELDAIAAVVIGGTLLSGGVGYVAGTLFGVLILGIIQTLISFDGSLSSWWTRIVIGALLFVFCLLQRLFESR
jgi:ribose/xylose/arabinose/galactoside ABC-type transport system permease subunit